MTKPEDRKIHMDLETAKGYHVNNARININTHEFVIDFIFDELDKPESQVVTRVMMSPQAAKGVAIMFHRMIKSYEDQLGEIKVSMPTPPLGGIYA